jgi:hypothetical protein
VLRDKGDGGAIAAQIAADHNLEKPGKFVGRVYANDSVKDARWINLVMGDYEGAAHVDISKLQHLALTMLLLLIYGLALWGVIDIGLTPQRGPVSAFPPISAGFLSLLGISHAAYLADKTGAQT